MNLISQPVTPARVPEPQPSPQILHVPPHSPASHHLLQKKSDKTMMSPFLLFFLLSQTLVYASLFIFSTPSPTLVTKAHCLHTLSLLPVISWSSWCSLPWGPCPSRLHSHPLPPVPSLTLPQSKHQLRHKADSPDLLLLPKFPFAQSLPMLTWYWNRAELLLPKFCLALGCCVYFRI